MMTEKIQNAGTVVVEAKAGKGSATLSMVSREGILSAHLVPNIASMMSMSSQRADGRKVWVREPLQVGREKSLARYASYAGRSTCVYMSINYVTGTSMQTSSCAPVLKALVSSSWGTCLSLALQKVLHPLASVSVHALTFLSLSSCFEPTGLCRCPHG